MLDVRRAAAKLLWTVCASSTTEIAAGSAFSSVEMACGSVPVPRAYVPSRSARKHDQSARRIHCCRIRGACCEVSGKPAWHHFAKQPFEVLGDRVPMTHFSLSFLRAGWHHRSLPLPCAAWPPSWMSAVCGLTRMHMLLRGCFLELACDGW